MKEENMDKLIGINIDEPVHKVKHADLKRSDRSIYRSICPACDSGLLMMRRNEKGELLAKDYCTLCGQMYIYTDIDKFGEQNE